MENKKIKIDITVSPYSGHLYPVLQMIEPLILDEKYDIRVYTGSQKAEIVKNMGLKCKILFEDKPMVFEDLVNTDKKANIFVSLNQFKRNLKLIPETMKELENEFNERKPDIVMSDFVFLATGLVCNKMNIPWMTTIPTPFIIESKTTTPSYVGGWYPHEGIFFKIRDSIGRFVIKNAKKMLCIWKKKELDALNFKLYNEKKEENIYSPYSILAIGMKELEFRDDFPNQLKWVGACSPAFDKHHYEAVDTSNFKKTVFVTNGTHVLWGKDNLIKTVEKLSKLYPDICFIISLGNYSKKDEKVQKKSENMFLYHYVDYEFIFPKIDYIIHHGGAGVFYKAIKFNKPSVIIPHDYDQFDYAVRAKIADVGIPAKLHSEKSIINAFNQLLNKKEWNNLYEISQKFKNYDTTEIVKNEIDRILHYSKK